MFADETHVEVLFDGKAIAPVFGALATKIYNGEDSKSYSTTAADGAVLEHVMFQLPEMTDDVHDRAISVKVTHDAYPSMTGTSNTLPFKYHGPEIVELQNSGSELIILGRNFGTLGVVNISSYSNETGLTARAALQSSDTDVSWSHTAIIIMDPGSSGMLKVVVGSEETEWISYDKFNPVLLAGHDGYEPDSAGYRTCGLDDAGNTRVLTVVGYELGSNEDNLVVTVGGADCPVVSGTLAEVDPATLGVDAEEGKTLREISCTVPPGSGTDK